MTRRSLTRRTAAVLSGCALAAFATLAVEPSRADVAGPFADATALSAAAPAGLDAAVPQDDPAVVRTRRITVDFSRLPGPQRRRTLAIDRPVRLDLFPDVVITATFDRFDPNPMGVTWVGHVEGLPASTVTLVYGGGRLAASVVMPGASYQVRPALAPVRPFGVPIHVVSQIDQSASPPETPPIEVDIGEAEVAAADARPLVDEADTIDVMVVYTAAAAAHAGGAAGIVNLINLGISETNTSYANSGVHQRLRLVHASQVSHQEPSSLGTSLTALRTGTRGLEDVAALRDLHRADLVTLLVHPGSANACGIGYLMTTPTTAFATFGFSVTDTQCVSPNYTFAHELGHNMGARHDWFVDSGVTPFSHAHGYVNPEPGQRWRTIMAYPDRCSRQGFTCTRLLYWANPDNRFIPFCTGRGFNCASGYWFLPGTPMGVAGGTSTTCLAGSLDSVTCDADDRRVLNDTALAVANFRQR